MTEFVFVGELFSVVMCISCDVLYNWLLVYNDVIFSEIPECSSPQPQSPQVFCASGEREGGRLDRG